MNAYLQHLKENLQALHSSELLPDPDYDSTYSDEDDGDDDDFTLNTLSPIIQKQHSRRHIPEKSLTLSLNSPGLERNRKYMAGK